MGNIAIIPARGGSKRIPRKNIRAFDGKPIISYPIIAAIESNCFDEIMVSTDDEEIAEIARNYGAKIPFYRSAKTSNDTASLHEVVEEVLSYYHAMGKCFDFFCCILPTTPFITNERIKEVLTLIKSDSFDSAFPVVRYSYPIQRGLFLDNGFIKMLHPENYSKRSQDFEHIYHDSGQFYWVRISEFMNEKRFFLPRSSAIIIPESEAHDIDTIEDWKIAELKYKITRSRKHGI